jgi:hypothetical protein
LARHVRLVIIEVADKDRLRVPELLAAGEQAINLALQASNDTVYLFHGASNEDSLVLGLYNRLPAESGLAGVYRRITGGKPVSLREGDTYAALAMPTKNLAEAASIASNLADCAAARGWGVTRLENKGIIEVFASSNVDECLRELFRFESSTKIRIKAKGLERLASAYQSPSWRFYDPPQPGGKIIAEEVVRGEYKLGVAIEVFEEYVADSWIYGIFHAAPPMEPFNIIATIRGTRLDEMMLANLDVAIKYRVEFHGIASKDIWNVLRRLSLRIAGRV